MLEGKSGLCQARVHAHTDLHGHIRTMEASDRAERLTPVLEVQVRNASSSPENILKFSPPRSFLD